MKTLTAHDEDLVTSTPCLKNVPSRACYNFDTCRAGSVLNRNRDFRWKPNRHWNLVSDGGPSRFLGLARLTEDTAQCE